MSTALDDLLREGDTVGVHDGSGSAGMYDDILESMRAEGHLTTDADGSTEMTGLNVSSIPTDLDPTLHAYSNQPTPEPRQPSIPIPPGLAGLASQVQPLDLSFDDPAQALALDYIKDRGEMGGKRKKPLSERAGWKDMDAKGNMPKRARGGKRKDVNSVEGFVGYQKPEEEEGVVIPVFGTEASGQNQEQEGQDETEALARDLAEAAGREMGLEQGMLEDVIKQSQVEAEVKDRQQEETHAGSEQPEEDRPVKHTNESRAEQNRRAQQVYRRRREEKMKELEASAAALEPTRKALIESHEKMKAVALEYECARIQISALHATLLSLNKQGVSILTTQYNFPIDPNTLKESETMRAGPLPKSDVEKAFEQLERQSRELAMSRRSD